MLQVAIAVGLEMEQSIGGPNGSAAHVAPVTLHTLAIGDLLIILEIMASIIALLRLERRSTAITLKEGT